VLIIAPHIPNMSVLGAMLVVGGFLVLAAIVAIFSPNTRGRHYEEISP
jgi:MFS transporter, putative metabolite:H+ symporter